MAVSPDCSSAFGNYESCDNSAVSSSILTKAFVGQQIADAGMDMDKRKGREAASFEGGYL